MGVWKLAIDFSRAAYIGWVGMLLLRNRDGIFVRWDGFGGVGLWLQNCDRQEPVRSGPCVFAGNR